jgi:hypothetical protein
MELSGDVKEGEAEKLISMKLDSNVLTIKLRLTDDEAKSWTEAEGERILVLKPKTPPSETP